MGTVLRAYDAEDDAAGLPAAIRYSPSTADAIKWVRMKVMQEVTAKEIIAEMADSGTGATPEPDEAVVEVGPMTYFDAPVEHVAIKGTAVRTRGLAVWSACQSCLGLLGGNNVIECRCPPARLARPRPRLTALVRT